MPHLKSKQIEKDFWIPNFVVSIESRCYIKYYRDNLLTKEIKVALLWLKKAERGLEYSSPSPTPLTQNPQVAQ